MICDLEIIEVKTDIPIREKDKCFMPMFKIMGLYWVYALPVENMYFDTIEKAKLIIEKMQKDSHSSKSDKYRIAKFINEKSII